MRYFIISLLSFFSLFAHSQCHLIAKWGIYDTKTLAISRERAISFLHIFKKDTRMSYQEAREYSATVGIPIETVMMSMGFSATETGYRQFVEMVSHMTTYDEIFVEKIVSVSREVNKDIIRALEDCYKASGIHSRIEHTQDDSLSYLVIFFRWEGNHDPVTVQVKASDRTGLRLDGSMLPSAGKTYTLYPDDQIRIPVTRSLTRSYGLSLRIARQRGALVIVRDNALTLYKQRAATSGTHRELKVEKIPSKALARTSQAAWKGGGDEELKRFSTTSLSGRFYLGTNANTLTGHIQATIKETIPDETHFEIKTDYTLYAAPAGWRIIGYGIDREPYGSSLTEFAGVQSTWISSPLHTTGPVLFYTWQGDTGRDQDQLEGCWIDCTLKEIVVLLEKE